MTLRRRVRPAVRQLTLAAAVAAMLAASPAGASAGQQSPAIDRLLALASDYVARFDNAFANVVAEERYTQSISNNRGVPTRRRELVSDFLMVKLPDTDNWLPFRDVFSVDGERVRDRDGRLIALLSTPDPLSLFQAQAIVSQSASYNIGVTRTMNLPILALQVLRATNHTRFEFSNLKDERIGGEPAFRLEYRERAQPTIVTGPGGRDMPIYGQLWVRPDGTVIQTDLWIDQAASIRATMTTKYRLDPEFGVAMPFEMHEEYTEPNRRRTTGLATYGRFRQFGVSTSSEMGSVNK